MSQKVVYDCDACGKVMGPKVHISMNLAVNSGIALPPKHPRGNTGSWALVPIQGFKHFCSPKCLSTFFTRKIEEITTKK